MNLLFLSEPTLLFKNQSKENNENYSSKINPMRSINLYNFIC